MLTFAIKKKRTPSIAPKRHAPTVSPMSHSLHLQQEKVRHILRGPTLQPKLKIGQPNDKYEQEADHVADLVMRMPEPGMQRQAEEELIQTKPLAEQITPLVRRQVEEEEEEEPVQAKLLQRQEESEEQEEEELIQTKLNAEKTPHISRCLEAQIHSMKGGGQPLPRTVRNFFEPRFNNDFSQVQIHTDDKAAKSAQLINASSYTVGRNIFFGEGQYSPQTMPGRRLIAHELVHVLQQSNIKSATDKIQRERKAATRAGTRVSTKGARIISAARICLVVGKKFNNQDHFNYTQVPPAPGWFYSSNSKLKPSWTATQIPQCLKNQGISPPGADVVVDWQGHLHWRMIKKRYRKDCKISPKSLKRGCGLCNVFVYDSLCIAGYTGTKLSSVNHYFGPRHDNRRSGIFHNKLISHKNILPGDIVVFDWGHMGIVLKKLKGNLIRTLDTIPPYKNDFTFNKKTKFLRVK